MQIYFDLSGIENENSQKRIQNIQNNMILISIGIHYLYYCNNYNQKLI